MSHLILLLAFLLTPQDTPPAKCTISGTVVDALNARPLNKVDVWVDTTGESNSQPAASAVTDAKGNFAIAGLDPGRYFLTGSRNGYLDTSYGVRRPGGGKIAIHLEPGREVKDVALKLFPYSVAAGMVHDTDGEPLSGVAVTMWAVQFDAAGKSFYQTAEMVTDDLGQFRIPGLEPGKYYLRAELDTGGVLVDSFYPGVPDPDAATMVELDPGARTTGLNVVLPRPRAFRVTVRIAPPAGFRAACELVLGPRRVPGPVILQQPGHRPPPQQPPAGRVRLQPRARRIVYPPRSRVDIRQVSPRPAVFRLLDFLFRLRAPGGDRRRHRRLPRHPRPGRHRQRSLHRGGRCHAAPRGRRASF